MEIKIDKSTKLIKDDNDETNAKNEHSKMVGKSENKIEIKLLMIN